MLLKLFLTFFLSRTHVKVTENGVEKTKNFVFNGSNYNNVPDNHFVRSFIQAYKYNIKNGGGDNLLLAENSTDYTINLQQGEDNSWTGKTVFWNPLQASKYLSNTDEEMILSPATILEHEFAYGVSRKTDPEAHRARGAIKDVVFSDKEEERVIKGAEAKTGQRNGEIKEGQHRKDHKTRLEIIRVGDPTSTKEFQYPWEKLLSNPWNSIKK